MILRFLGTGTSSGVPVIGCSCNVCLSKDPKDTRLRCSALLSYKNSQILIDAGPDIRQQLIHNSIHNIDALLITHAHFDHVIGIDELRPISWDTPMPIFADGIALNSIRSFFSYLFDPNPLQIGGGLTKLSPFMINPYETFRFKDITIHPLQVMHGKLPIIGYKINNLAYLTDVKSLPDKTIEQIRGIDTLVLSCLREKLHSTHLNKNEALELIEKINPKKSYLIHLNHEISHKEWGEKLPENISAAYDGLEISIPD